MTKKKKILLSLLVVVGVVCAFYAWRYLRDHKLPNFTKEYVLYVYPDMTEAEVLDSLSKHAGVKSQASLERCFSKMNVGANMQVGKYVIKPGNQSIYVARMLVRGWTTPQNMTLSGTIRSKRSLAKKISAQMMVDTTEVLEALGSVEFLAKYGFTPENVFAMIIPDTYQMHWSDSVTEIFDRLKKEYDAFWNEERLSKAKKLGFTPNQVSIMASIVSGETNAASEYATIAGAYLNRYRIGMKLQADPTVAYCFDYKLNRILRKHTQFDSPYNTYKYKGLPPAPINVPPKACIDAVLNPENHTYIYFCASPDFNGTHLFATTYSEHKENARKFQKALDERQKNKKS